MVVHVWWTVLRFCMCGGLLYDSVCVVDCSTILHVRWTVLRFCMCGGLLYDSVCVVDCSTILYVWWTVLRFCMCGGLLYDSVCVVDCSTILHVWWTARTALRLSMCCHKMLKFRIDVACVVASIVSMCSAVFSPIFRSLHQKNSNALFPKKYPLHYITEYSN